MNIDKIEEAVVGFVLNNGKNPKYVILDEPSYDSFVESLRVKPKIPMNSQGAAGSSTSGLVKVFCTGHIDVTIVGAKGHTGPLFEVV